MIRVQSLRKTFGSYCAVDGISLEVQKGEVLGFLGPNGAGKSTTMKMITCFLPPTSGTAEVCGHDILKNPIAVRQNIGYLPESAPSYSEMMVEEFLHFIAEIRGFSRKQKRLKVERVLDLTALKEVRHQMIETLSKGYRQRTCLAQSLLHDPPVLILDEPTDGLDPNQKHEVRSLIKRLSEQRAILVSTHILEEVEAVCDRAVIIAKGKVVADGTPDELLAKSTYHNAITLMVRGADSQALMAELRQIPDIENLTPLDNKDPEITSIQLFPKDQQSILRQIENFVKEHQYMVEQLFVDRGRLDEVFRKVTLEN